MSCFVCLTDRFTAAVTIAHSCGGLSPSNLPPFPRRSWIGPPIITVPTVMDSSSSATPPCYKSVSCLVRRAARLLHAHTLTVSNEMTRVSSFGISSSGPSRGIVEGKGHAYCTEATLVAWTSFLPKETKVRSEHSCSVPSPISCLLYSLASVHGMRERVG